MSELQAICKDVFTAGIEAGKSRDTIIIEMVQADDNISLNMAQNNYKTFADEQGLTRSRMGHKKEALEHIASVEYDLTDAEQRKTLRTELSQHFDVTMSTAHDYIRAYAEANQIDIGTQAPNASAEEIYEFVVANPTMDKPLFREFMEGLGRSKGNIDETWRGIVLARRIIASGAWSNVEFETEEAA